MSYTCFIILEWLDEFSKRNDTLPKFKLAAPMLLRVAALNWLVLMSLAA